VVAINSQSGRGRNDVSAYKVVFGQRYHRQYSCSREEAQRCWTVNEVLLVTNDSNFHNNVAMDFDLRVDNNEVSDKEDPASGYFSDKEIPVDEQEEVTEQYFFAHLMDGTDDAPQSFNKVRKALSLLYDNNPLHWTDCAADTGSLLKSPTGEDCLQSLESVFDEGIDGFGYAEHEATFTPVQTDDEPS
jgi:hypothetical protein